jgi:hypothetical protein
MKKWTTFLGASDAGIFAQGLFASMEKTAGVPGAAWETAPQIRSYIKSITPKDREKYCFVLVNALGAGEYYGSNINADYFPWNALAHEGRDYGYQTFLNAHVFSHHVNKDPAKAFGLPVLSVLNPRMKRVELIIRLEREKARSEGQDGVITRIDAGEFPDVSMGCKVPFDVCMICGNHSATRDDYCEHMRPPPEMRGIWGPNKILEDGRRICVSNLTPRFFDLSFVFIGADKTAKVMAKLAAKGNQICLGEVCAIPSHRAQDHALYDARGEVLDLGMRKTAAVECDDLRGPCGRRCADCVDRERCHTEKLASAFGVKFASRKMAEMVKSVPAGSIAAHRLPSLEKDEPDLPPEVLDAMAESPLPNALGTASSSGIVLKPHEFQRIVLIRMGEDDLADELDDAGQVFRPVHRFDDSVGVDSSIIARLLKALLPYVQARTAFGPSFRSRLLRAQEGEKKDLPTREAVQHPVLDKISAAYNGYRRNVLTELSRAREEVEGDPSLRSAILGDELVSMFSKTSSASPIIDLDSVAYLMGAHLSDRALLNNTAVATAVAVSNPWLLEEELPA